MKKSRCVGLYGAPYGGSGSEGASSPQSLGQQIRFVVGIVFDPNGSEAATLIFCVSWVLPRSRFITLGVTTPGLTFDEDDDGWMLQSLS